MNSTEPVTGIIPPTSSAWKPFFTELFNIYRTRFWTLVGMSILVFAIPIAGGIGLAIILVPATIAILFIFHSLMPVGISLCIILFTAGFLVELWLGSAVGIAVLDVILHYEKPVDVAESLKLGFKKAWNYLWLNLLTGFIIVGAFFILVVPGIFLSIAFSLAGVVFLVEDQRFSNAFLRSRDLIKGHWWYVFGCMLAVGFPFFIVSLIRTHAGSAGALISFILEIFILPLVFIGPVVVFKNLQSLKPTIEPSSSRKWKYALFILPIVIPLVLIGAFFPFILKKFSAIKSTIGVNSSSTISNPLFNALNTNDLMAQARDDNRISALAILKDSIGLYAAEGGSFNSCKNKTLYSSAPIVPPDGWQADVNAGRTAVDGTGWLPFDFASTSNAFPLAQLPLDPVNDPNEGLVYVAICNPANQTFKLEAKMESAIYNQGGSKDVTSNDGGNDPDRYEVGTELPIVIPTTFSSSY